MVGLAPWYRTTRAAASSALLARTRGFGGSFRRSSSSNNISKTLALEFPFRCRHSSTTTTATPLVDANHVVSSPLPDIADTYKHVTLFDFMLSADWLSDSLRNKTAILDGTTLERRSFGDYHADMMAMAHALRKDFGMTPNSIVALFTSNHVDFVPVSLAVAMCGAKVTPINPLYTPRELAGIVQQSRSEMVICHADATLAVTLEAVKECPTVKHVIVIPSSQRDGSVPPGTISLDDLKTKQQQQDEKTIAAADSGITNPQTHPYLIPYSSGTTGLPKGVCLSHSNMVANLLQLEAVERPSFPQNHKLISPLPFFHIYGLLVSAFYCAWQGQTVITTSGKFDLESFCQLVQEHEPQRAHLVPPIILGLSLSPVVATYDLSSLQCIVSAAAPLSAELEDDIQAKLCPMKQAWGMSELSPVGTNSTDAERRRGSVGRLVPSTLGKIMDTQANVALPPHTPGELWIKGPQVMMGYLEAPEKTAETMCPQSEWLRTGDVAHYDEDGYFYITDRVKELIKVRGYPVAPAELEALLLTHDKIQDAAVISRVDPTSGEVPRAYVVLQKKTQPLEEEEEEENVVVEEIYQWVKERVAPYKRLDGGIVVTDAIPKSGSGKILRRVLKDQEKAAQE